MLYSRSQSELEQTLFENPTSEYRGAPFWAWNGDLKPDELKRQIGWLQEMGFGGFHMHCRTGLVTPYLSEEFFQLIQTCVDEAKDRKMLAWLYDEDRWPSGAAGGIVTKDRTKRARHLLLTPDPRNYPAASEKEERAAESRFLCCYDVSLNEDGTLKHYEQVSPNSPVKEGSVRWYGYLELAEESPWYNNQTYADTLDSGSIRKFIEVTHEAYLKHNGAEFGKTIPSIFTDEPQFTHKTALGFAFEKKDIILPWTDNLPETYRREYGENLLEKLPELLWDLPEGKPSVTRYQYHAHISERFAEAFSDQLGGWCEEKGLKLTGHMLSEPTLQSQTASLGEVMRSLGSFQLPGIDMLCDAREYTTAKQAQSVSHQFGREGVTSELYGVTNWDFDFRGHKLAGDWQAALGVTVRVPHLSWVTMLGEAKRDYPASIHYQSPWFREYPLIENHFARLNTVMTRGKAKVKVGVIHPVESYWLHWGPQEQTSAIRKHLDGNFANLTDWLLFGQIDFDYISEALLPRQCETGGAPLKVGAMEYDVILVPGCETLRSTTVERLRAFAQAGGKLLFLGSVPTLVDAVPSGAGKELAASAQVIGFSEYEILCALEPERLVEIVDQNGARTNGLLIQMRTDGDREWLFIAHGRQPVQPMWDPRIALLGKDVLPQENITIRISGEYIPTLYNTMTGEIVPLQCAYQNGKTEIRYSFYPHDSILIRLEKGRRPAGEGVSFAKAIAPFRLGHNSLAARDADTPFFAKARVTLSEPNVLLLDQAESSMDGGAWQPKEEILRLDNQMRDALGYPHRKNHVAQPWVIEAVPNTHTLRLRFTVESEIEVSGASLAVEYLEATDIEWNGEKVSKDITGWYVDERIHTVKLPVIRKGENTLILTMPFGQRTNTENCFILGDFGVKAIGSRAVITQPVRELVFGDITTQGLPFYGGNVEYHLEAEAGENGLTIRTPHYRGALVGVSLDGKRVGSIVFAPYTLHVDAAPGKHEITLTLFGNRVNTFGTVHNCNTGWTWFGPDSWRTFGDEFSYEYKLKETGILKSPEVIKE